MAENMDRDDAGARIDRALRDGFANAIRLHREANLPMAIWEDEQVKLVSPFDIPLPEEAAEDPPGRRSPVPGRRAG